MPNRVFTQPEDIADIFVVAGSIFIMSASTTLETLVKLQIRYFWSLLCANCGPVQVIFQFIYYLVLLVGWKFGHPNDFIDNEMVEGIVCAMKKGK